MKKKGGQHGLEPTLTLNRNQLADIVFCVLHVSVKQSRIDMLFVGRLHVHVHHVQYLLAKISQEFTDAGLFNRFIKTHESNTST